VKIKNIKIDSNKLTIEKARIIAHLIGDGTHCKSKHDYNIIYEVKDEESLKQFYDDLIKVYGLEPLLEWNTSGITKLPIKRVRLRSKLAFYDLFRYATYFSKNWEIKPLFLKASLKIKKEFLRALFDDEVSVKDKYGVYLYSINKNGLLQIKYMLKKFKINVVYFLDMVVKGMFML
tara:strand:+ start:34045 stop:34572 length:528 start_codon:yes stop_codon:yes gene_type:complete